jgi:DNA-binding winged helix-turn-helix (wHTH) protein
MRVSFDEYVLDGEARELRRGGDLVALTPKAFVLLQALVAARPRALPKADLHAILWPDAVVVEANLSNLVGEIRAALGEDARQPRYIRTLHRFGYAFRHDGAAASGPRLLVTWPGGRAVLGDGEHAVGRDPELELCLLSASVSRRHAILRIRAGKAVVEDLGSKNGTWLNGERLAAPQPMAEGDELRVGSVRMAVGPLRAPGTTETGISRPTAARRRGR